MNTITISINNRDLAYTIDTYGMFTGESMHEMEIEHYREEYDLTEEECDTLGFDYDHPEIVKDLAMASVSTLENELRGDKIVKSISIPTKTQSPQFYNYTTDSYTAEWTIDLSELLKYANSHQVEFGKHLQENWGEFVNVPEKITAEYLRDDDDKLLVAMLDMYLRETINVEDYEMYMFEAESEVYINNMKLDAESQELIDSKDKGKK